MQLCEGTCSLFWQDDSSGCGESVLMSFNVLPYAFIRTVTNALV